MMQPATCRHVSCSPDSILSTKFLPGCRFRRDGELLTNKRFSYVVTSNTGSQRPFIHRNGRYLDGVLLYNHTAGSCQRLLSGSEEEDVSCAFTSGSSITRCSTETENKRDRCKVCVDFEEPEHDQFCHDQVKDPQGWQTRSPHASHALRHQWMFSNESSFCTVKEGTFQSLLTAKPADAIQSGQVDLAVEIHDKSPLPYGWMYVGVCGNSLITRAGYTRCFHEPGLTCDRDESHLLKTLCVPYGRIEAKAWVKSKRTVERVANTPMFLQSTTTKSHQLGKLKSTYKQKKPGKTASLQRDLFGRSSFHLLEVIFRHPSMNSSSMADNLQLLSKESVEELVGIANGLAVGLAGTGITLLLFVVSGMLSINATFDAPKVIRVFFGVGLVSLSLGVRRIGEVLKLVVRTGGKSRRKELVRRLRTEMWGFAYKSFPLVMLFLVKLGS